MDSKRQISKNMNGKVISLKHWKEKKTIRELRGVTKKFIELRLEDNSEDWGAYFELAQIDDDPASALEAAEIYLAHKDEISEFDNSIYYAAILAAWQLGDMDRVDYWLGKALGIIPNDLDINWALAQFGKIFNNKSLMASGCQGFIKTYDQFTKDHTCMGPGPIYNYCPDALNYCLYHLTPFTLDWKLNAL